jgi:hypothetical protein
MWKQKMKYSKRDNRMGRWHSSNGLEAFWKYAAVIVITLSLLSISLPTAKASAAADWDAALQRIHVLYSDYAALQESMKLDSEMIQKLRKQNNEDLKTVNQKLQSIDQTQLSTLKLEAETARKRHSPLLEKYTTLGQQAAAARKAKDLKTAAILDLQRNKLKASATAARAEIKTKTQTLAAARKRTADKIRPAKESLAAISALKKQITVVNKELSAVQKIRSEAHKRYQSGSKQGDAIAAASGMEASYAQMKIIQALQQKLVNWEKQISVQLRTAESKLPR